VILAIMAIMATVRSYPAEELCAFIIIIISCVPCMFSIVQ
jgi:hypothetical protein